MKSRKLPTLYPKSFKELKHKQLKWYRNILECYTLPLRTFHTSISRTDIMAEHQQGDLYYQALVAHGWIEEEPEMVQEAGLGIEPEEYLETDYRNKGSDEEAGEVEGIEEVFIESHPLGMISNPHITLKDPTDQTHSLEEEVAMLKQQLFAA